MNRYRAVGLLLVLILFAVLFAIAVCIPEPVYAGRPVSEWLDCGYEQAALALEVTGPTAAPVILSKLRREHPEYGLRAKYQRIWCKAPRTIRSWLPTPKAAGFDEARACSALLEIGPGVTPILTSGLRDANPAVRIASASALACLRQRGCNINLAIPYLRRAEEDPNPQVRRWADLALKGWKKS